MEKVWSNPEHVGKLVINNIDTLSKHFNTEEKKGDERDVGLLIKLSQAMAYQAQIYSGLQKAFDMTKRVQQIERVLEKADPEALAMGMNPVVIAEVDERTAFALR